MRDYKIPPDYRKLNGWKRIIELLNLLPEEQKLIWSLKLDNLFGSYKGPRCVKPKIEIDFGCVEGDIILLKNHLYKYNDKSGTSRHCYIDVKCVVVKIRNYDITLNKFESFLDESVYKLSRITNTPGYFTIIWEDELLSKYKNNMKNVMTFKSAEKIWTRDKKSELFVEKINLTKVQVD